jgi:hypothetical protein
MQLHHLDQSMTGIATTHVLNVYERVVDGGGTMTPLA